MDAEKIIKSTQEQAVAAWTHYLKQIRLERLADALNRQNENFAGAIRTIEEALGKIKVEVIERNRGGTDGMHGFIAEVAECGIGNARQNILGKDPIYKWTNDNGMVDLERGLDFIQQKFSQSGGHLSLKAVAEHLRKYPNFLNEGGKYQIPKDHYDKIMEYLNIPESVANKLPTSNGEFSLRQWKEVHQFFENNNIDVNKLEPSLLGYDDVQRDKIAVTMDNEKIHLKEVDTEQRNVIHQKNKPTLTQGIATTVVGAAAEGATAFCSAILRKRRSGKKFKDFDESDWIDIAGESGKGTLKGGIRGASLYLLTNFTETPAAVSSALITAAFGVAEQTHLFRKGVINEIQLIENAEMLCLDTAVSALSSFIGQTVIPIPILGAIIGNAVGTMIYQFGKDCFSEKEKKLVEGYLKELNELDGQLAEDYQQYIDRLNRCYIDYMELLDDAFDPDVQKALDGSVELAKRMGVPSEEILDNYDKILSYFRD